MKIKGIQFVFVVVIGLLFGYLCKIIAPNFDGRELLSFLIGSLSIIGSLIAAIAIDFTNTKRGVSIKIYAWFQTIVLAISNLIFSCTSYNKDIYVVTNLLILVVGWLIIYTMFKLKSTD